MGVMTRRTALLFVLLVLAVPVVTAAEPPRLVVILVVDQMRSGYIDDYGSHWTRGLRRLVDQGARFKDGAYPYLNTVTCVGHASISTGTVPAVHGIVLNSWLDRTATPNRMINCTDDPAHPDVSLDGRTVSGGHSASRLLVPSFGETLRKAQDGKSKVVTLSLKPRSAIMLAGHKADVAVWFDAGSWASSTAFTRSAPFVRNFVAAHPVEKDFGRTWERRLPLDRYRYPDDAPGEHAISGWTRTFPHVIDADAGSPEKNARAYDQWETTPFADAYLGAMAAEAVRDMKLGQRGVTDYLGVSFSTLDHAGHNYGPRSHEVQDVLAGLDETMGRLFDELDRLVGRDRYVVALSADHGVATLPEQLRAEGQDAGRVANKEVGARAERAIAEVLGGSGPFVARPEYTDLYLHPGVMDRLRANPEGLDRVKAAIRQVPGVADVIVSADLDARKLPADRMLAAASLSHYPGRSGDLVVIPKPNWFFVPDVKSPDAGGTTHGTAQPYDARVPVLFMGAGIVPGTYEGPAAPIDIAPTLARLCGVTLPHATGRVLEPALKAAQASAKESSAPRP
jgi:predicted AlkP superfamily pyrophosphatase or phosphodiesterase